MGIDIGSILRTLFLVSFGIWAGLSVYVLLNRVLYDLRHRELREGLKRLHHPSLAAASTRERLLAVEDIARPLPRRTIERIAADASLPDHIAETFACYAVSRWGVAHFIAAATRTRGWRIKWRRIAALHVLARSWYPNMLELLETAVADRDPHVVQAAVVILGRMDTRPAAELLVATLRLHRHAPSRVATQLEHFSTPIADLLIPLLSDAVPHVRYWAAQLLSGHREVTGLDVELVPLIADPEPTVRKAAVQTLGTLGGSRASAAAGRLLSDPVDYVRAHAARALGRMLAYDYAEDVVRLLSDRSWWVRLASKESLVEMGRGIWRRVAAGLEVPDRFGRDGAAEVLQNLGVLDELASRARSGENVDADDLAILWRALEVGGDPMLEALVGRTGLEAPDALRERLQALDFELVRTT